MPWHGRLALTLFVLLGLVLKLTRGHWGLYGAVPLAAIVAGFVAFGAACVALRPSRTGSFDAKPGPALARVAALFAVLLWLSPGLIYPINHRWDAGISLALGMLMSAC